MVTIEIAANEIVRRVEANQDQPANAYVKPNATAFYCGVAKGKHDKFGTPLPADYQPLDAFSFYERKAYDAGYHAAMFDMV